MLNNKNISKVFLAAAYVGISFLCAGTVYAQTTQTYTVVPLATVPNLTQSGVNINPATYVQNLYALAIGVGAVIAVLSGVYAGLEYMLSETSFTSVEKAKKRMWDVLLGAALLLCSWLLLDLINPQLVNWNLNLGTTEISTKNLSNDIAANTAGQKALAQQEIYATQAINSIQEANAAQSALAVVQEQLASIQKTCAGNSTGDCDPTNPNSTISKAQATVSTQKAVLANAQASVAVNQLGSDLNAQLVSIQQAQQDLKTAGVALSQTVSAATSPFGQPLAIYNLVSGNAEVAYVNANADVTTINQSLQAAANLATTANVQLDNLITQAEQSNNQILVTQLQQQKATLTQEWQTFSASAKTTN